MNIPLLCVGTGRSLMLASVSDAGLFSVGQARLMFRRYFDLWLFRVFDQFGSGVVSGEVGGRRKFSGRFTRFHRVSNRLNTCARRRTVSGHSRICACGGLHQPKEEEERHRRERQRCERCQEQNRSGHDGCELASRRWHPSRTRISPCRVHFALTWGAVTRARPKAL
jgi:hypothetical protein